MGAVCGAAVAAGAWVAGALVGAAGALSMGAVCGTSEAGEDGAVDWGSAWVAGAEVEAAGADVEAGCSGGWAVLTGSAGAGVVVSARTVITVEER